MRVKIHRSEVLNGKFCSTPNPNKILICSGELIIRNVTKMNFSIFFAVLIFCGCLSRILLRDSIKRKEEEII